MVAWQDPVIDYCERQSHGFWAEPLNAITNVAFLLAAAGAFALWRRQRKPDSPALALIIVTALVGIGSFIFHTLATRGAILLDVIPIAIFIYGYFLLALRRFFGLGAFSSVAITIAFGLGSYALDSSVQGLNGSVGYLPALFAMAGFAALLWARSGSQATERLRRRRTALGLAAAALVFTASLIVRTIDRGICQIFPLGTHFMWHLLNAVVLWLLLRTAILASSSLTTEPDDSGSQATPSQKASMPTAA
jgi:hypothetical protein